MLNSEQYGFRKGKSTLKALIDLTETIRVKISESEKSICTFLDLSKAFDTVNHGILLEKIETYGARGIVLQLLASFLKNRKQFVQIDEKISEVREINVGVPQGSVLGALLFFMYMNDITDIRHENSQIALFADDCWILTSHQHNPFLAHEKHLHQISKWLSVNKLTLNLEKTFHLKFGRTKSVRNTLLTNEKLLKTESKI